MQPAIFSGVPRVYDRIYIVCATKLEVALEHIGEVLRRVKKDHPRRAYKIQDWSIREIIIQQKGSFSLELQQRSIEFNFIIQKHENIKSALVERITALDETTYSAKKVSYVRTTVLSEKTNIATPPVSGLNLPNGVAKTTPTSPLLDLLDLSLDDTHEPSSSTSDF